MLSELSNNRHLADEKLIFFLLKNEKGIMLRECSGNILLIR